MVGEVGPWLVVENMWNMPCDMGVCLLLLVLKMGIFVKSSPLTRLPTAHTWFSFPEN